MKKRRIFVSLFFINIKTFQLFISCCLSHICDKLSWQILQFCLLNIHSLSINSAKLFFVSPSNLFLWWMYVLVYLFQAFVLNHCPFEFWHHHSMDHTIYLTENRCRSTNLNALMIQIYSSLLQHYKKCASACVWIDQHTPMIWGLFDTLRPIFTIPDRMWFAFM